VLLLFSRSLFARTSAPAAFLCHVDTPSIPAYYTRAEAAIKKGSHAAAFFASLSINRH
jgi:hypothetical protein